MHNHMYMYYRDQQSFSSGSTSQSLVSSNQELSLLWRSLPEEWQKYKEDAKKKSGNLKEVNVKKECKKIVGHLQEMVLHVALLYMYNDLWICSLIL